jgi:hypothetical protein
MPAIARSRWSSEGLALDQLQAVREHREQVVEVVRDAAGQLAERVHLLRLAQHAFGVAQPFLVAQPLGDVVDELVGAGCARRGIAQRVVAHLVRAPVATGDRRTRRSRRTPRPRAPAPHRSALDAAWCSGCAASSSSMLEPTPGAGAEDALELVRRRLG